MRNDGHKNEIALGDDQWIPYVDIQGHYGEARNIDSAIAALDDLWNHLETYCVAGCCGLAAFDFTREHVEAIQDRLDPDVASRLNQFRETLMHLPGDVLVSDRLNMYLHRSQALALVDHLLRCFPIAPPN